MSYGSTPRPSAYVRSLVVTVVTKSVERLNSASRRPDGPVKIVPSGRVPDASMGVSPDFVRQSPTPSKLSSANPIGSIFEWHEAHTGFLRCSSMRSRMDAYLTLGPSGSGGTL